MIKGLVFLTIITIFSISEEKRYSKNYFPNGNLKSEGWIKENHKVNYWFYYFENGNKKEEGHYGEDKKNKWWIFYNPNGEILKKTEFKNDQMDGLCIIYKQGKIIKAEKYKLGKKVHEWNTLSAYQKDINKK
jgi:antitoxin component YwqK of YwqJK toxin-antitoxin module